VETQRAEKSKTQKQPLVRWRFEALEEPTRGCVIVMEHNKDGFDHVAFLDEVGDLPSKPKGDINAKI